MLLTVLGCQAGVPRHGRPCSGYLVSDAGTTVLLDCGPGVATALSGTEIEPDAVVVTHWHLDHVHDLLPLAKQRVHAGAPRVPLLVPAGAPLDAWAALFPVPTFPRLDRPFAPAFDVREYTPGVPVAVGALTVTPHAVEHAVPACGIRVDGPGGSLAYTGDTRPCGGLLPLARGVDLLLAEATLDRPDDGAHGHLCAADAARAALVAEARALVLTHLPDAALAAARIAAATALFSGPVAVAEPGASIPVRPRDRSLL